MLRLHNCILMSRNVDFIIHQRCHLLELPAELRDRIWKFALFEAAKDGYGRFKVDIGVLQDRIVQPRLEPDLLRICHQIRKEALPIYLMNRCFLIHVYNCDSAPIVAFEERCKKVLKKQTREDMHVIVYLELDENRAYHICLSL